MPTRILIDHRLGVAPVLRHPEKAHRPDNPIQRKPAWIRVKAPTHPIYHETRALMRENRLVTVCEEAACPNIGECWSQRHATMMIMGDTCTRACSFCNVRTGQPGALDADEPARVADAVARLGLAHVVITSVDRDDLPDGGAGAFRRRDPRHPRRRAGHHHRGADAGFPAQAGRRRDRGRGSAGRVQPQSRNRAAALPDDPPRRALLPVASPAGHGEAARTCDLHQIRPDGRPRGGARRRSCR